VPRPAARVFSIGVPQRGHGSPADGSLMTDLLVLDRP